MFVVGFVFGLVAMFAAMTWGTPIATASNSLNDPAIVTESGPLKGVDSAQINEYLGIPYAAPPVPAVESGFATDHNCAFWHFF